MRGGAAWAFLFRAQAFILIGDSGSVLRGIRVAAAAAARICESWRWAGPFFVAAPVCGTETRCTAVLYHAGKKSSLSDPLLLLLFAVIFIQLIIIIMLGWVGRAGLGSNLGRLQLGLGREDLEEFADVETRCCSRKSLLCFSRKLQKSFSFTILNKVGGISQSDENDVEMKNRFF